MGSSTSAATYGHVGDDEASSEYEAAVELADSTGAASQIDYGATDIIGRRKGMEDAYCDHSDLNAEFPELSTAIGGSRVRRALFGVFDGHGGRQCSEYVANELAKHVVCELVRHGEEKREGRRRSLSHSRSHSKMQRRYSSHKMGVSEGVQASLLNAVLTVERAYGEEAKRQYDEYEMKKHRIRRSERKFRQGTCAIVAYLQDDLLAIANVGDSRAVLCRGGRTLELSEDHKPGRPDERNRIELAGGEVRRDRTTVLDRLRAKQPLAAMAVEKSKCLSSCFRWMGWSSRAPLRVYPGAIAIARALGDCYLKDPYYDYLKPEQGCCSVLSPIPDIIVTNVCAEDEFVILGCDGLWDVMSSADAVKLVRRANCKSAQQASDLLVQTAFHLGSGDNISVVVLFMERWYKSVLADHEAGEAGGESDAGGGDAGGGAGAGASGNAADVSTEEVERRIAAAVASVEMEEEAEAANGGHVRRSSLELALSVSALAATSPEDSQTATPEVAGIGGEDSLFVI